MHGPLATDSSRPEFFLGGNVVFLLALAGNFGRLLAARDVKRRRKTTSDINSKSQMRAHGSVSACSLENGPPSSALLALVPAKTRPGSRRFQDPPVTYSPMLAHVEARGPSLLPEPKFPFRDCRSIMKIST